MKKTFVEWVVIAAICVLGVGTAFGRNIGDAYMAVYTCLASDGTPVEGQNITLKIQKASNGYWFDFNDSAFKNASWTNKSVSLSEDTTEHQYYYAWTPPAGETAPEQYLFVYDNTNTTYKDHQIERVDYQVIGNSTFAGGAVASVTGNVWGNVTGSVGSVIGGVTVTTNNDKTGYSLTTAPPTAAEIQAELEENGASILDTLGDRLLGTIAAGTHNPQSGDAYAIVNNGTYGNSAIKGYVDDIESRLTAARAGYLDKLNVTGTLAHSDAAATYKADVSALALEATLDGIKGTTFNTSTDSLEALRDRGDSAWITATGFSTHSAADVLAAIQAEGTYLKNLYDNQGNWLTATGFATPGDAMTLTAAYDAAKTAAQAGDTMKVSSGTGAGQVNLVSGAVALQADQAVNATKIEGLDATDQLDAHDGNPPAASDIKTALEADGSKLDHLWEMTEDDGGVRRYTANALEQAPTGGSAPTAVQIREEIDSNSTQLAAIVTSTGTTIPGLINDLNNLDLQDVRDAMKLAPSEGAAASGSIDDQLATAQADLDNPSQYKADVSGVATSSAMTAAFNEIKGATWSSTTDTLEAIRDRGDAAWITASGFAVPGDAMTLTAAYDAAKTAAPAGTALSNVVWTDTKAGYIDAAMTSRLAAASYTAPDNTNIGNIWNAVNSGTYGLSNLKTLIDALSSDIAGLNDISASDVWSAETRSLTDKADFTLSSAYDDAKTASQFDPSTDEVDIGSVKGTGVASVNDFKATGFSTHTPADVAALILETPANKLETDATGQITVGDIAASALAKFFSQDSGKVYGDAVAGSIVKEIVDNVEGGSSVGDWTSNEKTEIKTVLGVTGTGTPTSTPSSGALRKIYNEMSKDYHVGP